MYVFQLSILFAWKGTQKEAPNIEFVPFLREVSASVIGVEYNGQAHYRTSTTSFLTHMCCKDVHNLLTIENYVKACK